ncbi:hypothetical protein BDN70DRAFT_933687 [Pholiota conissans]|uniref:F-box domain-containing protein n=1 Tax=Pholiota conissans TaxID=109636 RepID=A0A9P5YYP6_9AGAR|nr:hypothetical protein BDN70DRAFT_933687 [Pholiota conissans]
MSTSDKNITCNNIMLTMGEYVCDPTNHNVCDSCRKIAELENKIKMTLVALENERQKIKEEASKQHDKLIHHLPFELAAYIFELCVLNDDNFQKLEAELPMAHRATVCAPLVLSAVCRKWRSIAHANPQLWKIVPIFSRKTKPLPSVSLIQAWIERSRRLPLSINLTAATTPKDAVIPILDLIGRYAEFWDKLAFDGETAHCCLICQPAPTMRQSYASST